MLSKRCWSLIHRLGFSYFIMWFHRHQMLVSVCTFLETICRPERCIHLFSFCFKSSCCADSYYFNVTITKVQPLNV